MNIKNILYLLIIFSLFLFLFGIIVYIISLIYSSIKGSPYVPTSKKLLKKFFGEIKFKKNSFFIELGSGDGRILRYIAKYYQINGLGVDINPILVWFSKVYSWLENVNDRVKFERMDAMNVDLTKADYIYIFLMPKFIKKLRLFRIPKTTFSPSTAIWTVLLFSCLII